MKKKALSIGIDSYGNDSDLSGCVNDAREIERTLKKHKNGEPNYDVKLVENIQSKDLLSEKIEELFEGDCAGALLYFSGHGHVDKHDLASLVTPDMSSGSMGFLWIIS